MTFASRPLKSIDYTPNGGQIIIYRIMEDGTAYHADTSERIVSLLQDAKRIGTRLIIHYGDTLTGQAWGDVETGRIGRSTGDIKVPLVIKTRRSTGGGSLLDHCIVKIETASGKFNIYTHPLFKEAKQ